MSAVQSRPSPPFFSSTCRTPPVDFSTGCDRFVTNSGALQRIPAHVLEESPSLPCGASVCENWGVDLSDLKGRVAEALVESVFRRAQYRVVRAGRESSLQGLLRQGPTDFTPDFLVWKPVPDGEGAPLRHRLIALEVKYRANPAEFLRRDLEPNLPSLRAQWPELYYIVVTDNPGEGRLCFLGLSVRDASTPPVLVDLHQLPELDIFESTIREYEALVRELFSLLSRYASSPL